MKTRSVIFLLSLLAFLATPTLRADPPATQPVAIEQKLAGRIDDLSLKGLTVQQVFLAIQDKTRLNIIVDWSGLEQASNIDLKRTLHGRLAGLTVGGAIQLTLTEAGVDAPTKMEIGDRAVTIAMPDSHKVEVRVYKIDMLLASWKSTFPATRPSKDVDPSETSNFGDMLIKAIEDSVDSESWRDAGGTEGSIQVIGDRIIITQTVTSFVKIEKFLHDLENPRAK